MSNMTCFSQKCIINWWNWRTLLKNRLESWAHRLTMSTSHFARNTKRAQKMPADQKAMQKRSGSLMKSDGNQMQCYNAKNANQNDWTMWQVVFLRKNICWLPRTYIISCKNWSTQLWLDQIYAETDSHLKSWKSEYFVFHNECDLELACHVKYEFPQRNHNAISLLSPRNDYTLWIIQDIVVLKWSPV